MNVSAIHKCSPLTLDFKTALKEWITVVERRELHALKYWSPDAQLQAVKQKLRHLVVARRYNPTGLSENGVTKTLVPLFPPR